jgi:hypothetical protein
MNKIFTMFFFCFLSSVVFSEENSTFNPTEIDSAMNPSKGTDDRSYLLFSYYVVFDDAERFLPGLSYSKRNDFWSHDFSLHTMFLANTLTYTISPTLYFGSVGNCPYMSIGAGPTILISPLFSIFTNSPIMLGVIAPVKLGFESKNFVADLGLNILWVPSSSKLSSCGEMRAGFLF